MLHSVFLEGFRSFEQPTTLPFGKLTLIAGANNVGKSSVIQAILAFVQSEEMQSRDQLLLDGLWCQLGSFDQVVSGTLPANRRSFSIGLTGTNRGGTESVDCLWSFGPPDDSSSLTAPIVHCEYTSGNAAGCLKRVDGQWQWHAAPPVSELGDASFVNPWRVNRRVRDRGVSFVDLLTVIDGPPLYVGPFRVPPQRLYPARSTAAGPPLGAYGEYTASALWAGRNLRTDILPPGTPDGKAPLLSTVNAWWSYVFDGKLALQIDAPALGFTLAVDTPSADRLGLERVGFGLSQSLPVIAASLLSTPGDFVCFETPEAHMHPGAQHRLSRLFVELARRGRQVVVETHSEHVVNAVCLAIKEGILSNDDVSMLFFEQRDGRTTFQKVDIDSQGRKLKYPAGFFDQAAIDLADLIR